MCVFAFGCCFFLFYRGLDSFSSQSFLLTNFCLSLSPSFHVYIRFSRLLNLNFLSHSHVELRNHIENQQNVALVFIHTCFFFPFHSSNEFEISFFSIKFQAFNWKTIFFFLSLGRRASRWLNISWNYFFVLKRLTKKNQVFPLILVYCITKKRGKFECESAINGMWDSTFLWPSNSEG